MHSALYFPLEIVLHIHHNKQIKVLLMLMHDGENIVSGRGLEANVALSFASSYISLLTATLMQYFPVVHSLQYLN